MAFGKFEVGQRVRFGYTAAGGKTPGQWQIVEGVVEEIKPTVVLVRKVACNFPQNYSYDKIDDVEAC